MFTKLRSKRIYTTPQVNSSLFNLMRMRCYMILNFRDLIRGGFFSTSKCKINFTNHARVSFCKLCFLSASVFCTTDIYNNQLYTIEYGGLGLPNPAIQQRFLQNIVNPLCVQQSGLYYIARYWIGFQLANLRPNCIFLRANNLPKPDKNTLPDYYGDILQFAKIADLTKIKKSTTFIYFWLRFEFCLMNPLQ